MKYLRVSGIIITIIFILFPACIHAENAKWGDVLVTCNEDGSETGKGQPVTNAVVTVAESADELDTTGNYSYCGVDIGVFKKPVSGEEWDTVYINRVPTTELEIEVVDFGSIASYEYEAVYTLGYRVLYQSEGMNSSSVIEGDWEMVPESYFHVNALAGAKLVPCDLSGQVTGAIFAKLTISVQDIADALSATGDYSYYGADIGVFKKPSVGEEWDAVFLERIPTNEKEIEVMDFGNPFKYIENQVYAIGYKILYEPSGADSNPIIEADWKIAPDSYFKVKPAMIMSTFTDRVTAANNWIDGEVAAGEYTEEHGQELNNYFPNSEVVCKFVLDPGGVDVQKYNINFNANSDSDLDSTIEKIENLGIDYIKIVRIDHGEVKGEYNGNPGPPPPGGSDDPLCGNTSQKSIDFEINNSGTDVLTVYVKYKFKNEKINGDITGNMPSEFKNKVSVEAVTIGGTKTLEPMENTIRLRKAIPKYM